MNFPTPFMWTTSKPAPPVAADDSMKLLLHFSETAGATTVYDSSSFLHDGIGLNGAAISAAQSKFTPGSMFFDGVNDAVQLSDSVDWAFGAGDFTIDCWIYPINVTAGAIFSQFVGAGTQFNIFSIGTNGFADGAAGGVGWVARNSGPTTAARYQSTGAVVTTGSWQHIAFERQGTNFKIYVNGISVALTATTSIGTKTLDDEVSSIYVGMRQDGSMPYSGYMKELRVSKGIARYGGANFTPQTLAYPDGPFNLLKSMQFFSPWAQWFEWAPMAARTDIKKCTVSVWFKRDQVSTYNNIFQGYNGGSDVGTYLYLANRLVFLYGGAAGYENSTAVGTYVDRNVWHHLCLSVDDTLAIAVDRVKIYIDGVLQTLPTNTNIPINQGDQFAYTGYYSAIGSQYDGTTGFFDGKLADFYFIDGQALLPSAFTTGTGVGVILPKRYLGTYGNCGQHHRFQNPFPSTGEDSGPNNMTRRSGYTSLIPQNSFDVPGFVAPTALSYSIKLVPASSHYMYCDRRAQTSVATDRRKGTFACWFKRDLTAGGAYNALFGGYDGGSYAASGIQYTPGNRIEFQFGSDGLYISDTNAQFPELGVWRHLVVAWDTTQATPANRIIYYVDGVLQAHLAGSGYPLLNYTHQFMLNNYNNSIGVWWDLTSTRWNGQFTDIYFIDGQTLNPTSFITGTGLGGCHPKAYAGTYGNIGFHLRFDWQDGYDTSPNANNFWPVWMPTFPADVPT